MTFVNSMENKIDADDELDCCGNGCNNCILDRKILKQQTNDSSSTINVLSSSYVLFRLISVTQCTASVFQLKFQFDHDQSIESVSRDLNIPLSNYLMLRTRICLVNRVVSDEFKNYQSDDDKVFISSRKDKHDQETENDLICRPYTPIEVDSANLTFKILVKLLKRGSMSQYIASLKCGDLTEWKGSYGHFEYIANKYKSMICITQGVGIAPLYRIFKNILNDETDETRIHMLACFKDMDNILIRDELYGMKQFWNFSYTIYLSQPATEHYKLKYNEPIEMCRLDKTEICNILSSSGFDNNSTVIICGGETFSQSISTILLATGHKNFVIL